MKRGVKAGLLAGLVWRGAGGKGITVGEGGEGRWRKAV